MPRIIFKCPYIKPGTENVAVHLGNYVRYVAARDGAEMISPDTADYPATKRQQAMVGQILRDFPLSREMFEYEDYLISPTRSRASPFITSAIEENCGKIAKLENYVGYIAQRPHAERVGSHGLFNGAEKSLPLSRVAEEVSRHPGNVWLPIISMRREDAARLGYDSAKQCWMNLDAGGIQAHHIYLDLNDTQLLPMQEYCLQDSCIGPAVYLDIDYMPISVFFGQDPPFAPVFYDVQHCVQHFQAADFCWLPLFGKAVFHLLILFYCQLYPLTISQFPLCEQPPASGLVSCGKLCDVLLRQNSMACLGWDVHRWAARQTQTRPESVKEELRIFPVTLPAFLYGTPHGLFRL